MFRPALSLRRAAAVPTLLALAAGALVAGPSAHAATPSDQDIRLRVMAYNIQAGAKADHVFDLERQVADMDAIMDRRPGRKILIGDFNAQPDDAELAPLWTRLADAMTVVGQRDTPTYPADAPTARIDYVTYSPGIRAVAAHVPDTLASDHRPVVADLRAQRRSP